MLAGSKMNKQDGDSDSQAASETTTAQHSAVPFIPEDIWCHIHSLMPMRDAARAACISRSFLRSWRCRPDLILDSSTRTLHSMAVEDDLITTIDSILRNHSGTGLKRLMLILDYEYDTFPHVEGWLKAALRPGIEELRLSLEDKTCILPCSVLSDDGVRNSIRSLQLEYCTFRPTAELGLLRSLTKITLECVRITGDELECLLSNSPALEKLDVYGCSKISSLKIPCALQQLSCLRVTACKRLDVIENKAPNLSSFVLDGDVIGETKQIKKLAMYRSACHCRVELPSIMPNLEKLSIHSHDEEVVSTPMLPSKFLHLKHLTILIFGVTNGSPYDCFSLVSFLDASPSLQTLHIDCSLEGMESVSGSPSDLRQLPEHCRNDRLWIVSIVPFSSAKSLVELTRCIVKSAVSLKHITLDTLRLYHLYHRRSGGGNSNKSRDHPSCGSLSQAKLDEASRAVTAIRDYIEDVVPATAQLTVLAPCARHSIPKC